MSQPACMPFVSPSACDPSGCSTNPAGCLVPQGTPNPIGNAPDGCVPSPDGTCKVGFTGSNPTPGPDTQYFAQAEGGCCVTGDSVLNKPIGTILASEVTGGTLLAGVNTGNWAPLLEIVASVGSRCLPYLTFTIGGETMSCTAAHTFYSAVNQPIEAGSLEVGATVLDVNGNPQTVTSIKSGGAALVYCILTESGFNTSTVTTGKTLWQKKVP